VINYDIPYDVEAYVHRIGRTGRAGRTGDAILFAANRERRLLRAIEKATGMAIEKMVLPSAEEAADKRIGRFKQRITATLATADLDIFRRVVEEYQHEYGVPVIDIAAALAGMAQGKLPLQASGEPTPVQTKSRRDRQHESTVQDRDQVAAAGDPRQQSRQPPPARDMERFRIEVGSEHGVKPANIVGAIANEAELDSEYIGRIDIHPLYSTVDLPAGMPKELFKHLKGVWVSGQRLQISRLNAGGGGPRQGPAAGGKSGKAATRRKPRQHKQCIVASTLLQSAPDRWG
jgi:ATP-dependent RNA helicase DeaD